jgi:hypothetical protein
MTPSRYRSLVLALAMSPVFACAAASGQDDVEEATPPLLGLPLPLPLPTPGPPTPSSPAASGTCGFMNNYTAAIAEATIACTGTLGPSSFIVSSTGLLQRNFSQCSPAVSGSVAAGLQQTIDDLLGLQQRANVPEAKACFASQWTSWRTNFLNSGNSVCPSWTVVGSIGTATLASVALVIQSLPILSSLPTGGILQNVLDATKENFLYAVSLPLPPPIQPCGDALSCAAACTGGLPGFYLGQQNGLAIGDPCWWLSSTTYASGSDPFKQNDYYHPMSYYGDPPGDIYGHRNRVSEACSRWGGGYHYQGVLELDCVSPGDPSSPCSSICNVP